MKVVRHEKKNSAFGGERKTSVVRKRENQSSGTIHIKGEDGIIIG